MNNERLTKIIEELKTLEVLAKNAAIDLENQKELEISKLWIVSAKDCIDKIEKTNRKSYYTFYEQIIIKGINFEDDKENNQDLFNKVFEVEIRFNNECYLRNSVLSKEMQFKKWLQGLPSCLNIPFYNYDILDKARHYGYIFTTEEEEDLFLEKYYSNLTHAFFTLRNNL